MPRLATIQEIADFYTRQSERFGPSGVLAHHEERAARLRRLVGTPPLRVLELGAGAGGTAVATAMLGYEVTSIELSSLRTYYAKQLAEEHAALQLKVIEGDFYTTDLREGYDVVTYWNGFGMGSDADQRRLLRRVATQWLRAKGTMLVDVFNPTWWARLPGEARVHEEYQAIQQTTFDYAGNRFVDRWWPKEHEEEAIMQSIRCYSPSDLHLLLEGTGLMLASIDMPNEGNCPPTPLIWLCCAQRHKDRQTLSLPIRLRLKRSL